MNLVPPGFGRPPQAGEQARLALHDRATPSDSLRRQWAALHAAAAVVASLTQDEDGLLPPSPLPPALQRLDARRQRMVEETLGDLVAIMEPGLTALLAIHRAGGDTRTPARALWREFIAAHGALLALAGAGSGRES